MSQTTPSEVYEKLRGLLSYDPETGEFRWLASRRNGKGLIPGSINGDGYLQIQTGDETYKAHRLAWLYVHGVWPAKQLDHINGIRTDNRIANLREATNAENGQNRAIARNNRSGHKGVTADKRSGKWKAYIKINKRMKHIGYFHNLDDAVAARVKAKAELHTFHPSDPTKESNNA